MYYFSAGFLTPRKNDSSLGLSADDMRDSEMLRSRGILKAATLWRTINPRGQIVLFGINRPYRTALILTLSKNWPRIFPI